MQTQSPPAAPQPPTPPPPPPLDREALAEQIRTAIEATRQGTRVEIDPGGGPVGTPGVVVRSRPDIPDLPPNVLDATIGFFMMIVLVAVGIPIARAIGRRIERPGQSPARLSPELSAQLAQLSQSVEAIAIEVERISEAQRFTTKLLTEEPRRSVGAGEATS